LKNILSTIAAAALLVASSWAFAAPPPASVTLPAKQGNVEFNHKLHQSQGCKNCHGAGTPAKIELTQEKAHALCAGCHKEKGKGPADVADKAKCGECHKK
jgi:predicted CXXCH cytochrome family protein